MHGFWGCHNRYSRKCCRLSWVSGHNSFHRCPAHQSSTCSLRWRWETGRENRPWKGIDTFALKIPEVHSLISIHVCNDTVQKTVPTQPNHNSLAYTITSFHRPTLSCVVSPFLPHVGGNASPLTKAWSRSKRC